MLGKTRRICGVAVLCALTVGCTGPINEETLRDKPSDYLCRLLGPDYLTLPGEEVAIYRELERRGERCIATSRVIVSS